MDFLWGRKIDDSHETQEKGKYPSKLVASRILLQLFAVLGKLLGGNLT